MAQAGPMQAGGMMDLEQYLAEVLCADRPMAYTGVPCFGHPLYDRDPRAELLLEMVRDLSGAAATRERLLEFVDAVHRRTGATQFVRRIGDFGARTRPACGRGGVSALPRPNRRLGGPCS